MKPITDTSFIKRPLFKRGKVRDIYEVDDLLLIISTDRISAFDVVMDEGIPGKGKVLNQLAEFWFEKTKDIIPNHFVSSSVNDLPPDIREYEEYLEGRFMLVKKTEPLPVECVVRGYLAGGGWEEYKRSGKISGVSLPAGLEKSAKLPYPVFTPATKAEIGEHDVNVTFDDIERIIGSELARKVKKVSLKLYERGSSIAESRGMILADTKFEFGLADGELLLIDEL
ncbi:MAG: phosphoribosylaminoimidazolesuccinocarboxamide synthase, partial [Actinomycetota bacterium]|nr:phosphoribosylaminoimidazolesuccinocarboxamide synthase [Actinomycetota bacterium]